MSIIPFPISVAVAVKTPVGTIVHTGDFKIDSTPIDGEMIDFAKFSELGKRCACAAYGLHQCHPTGFYHERKIVEQAFAYF